MQTDGLQVVGGQHGDYARARERLRLVDRLDARMRVRTAHERAEQHARQLDVVDVVPLAPNELCILLAQQRGAHALQLLFAFLDVGQVAHEVLRSVRCE